MATKTSKESPEIIYRMTKSYGSNPTLPELTGWCKSKLYAEIKKGNFPQGIKVGQSRGWPGSVLAQWQKEQGFMG